jgi:hypothetical protein
VSVNDHGSPDSSREFQRYRVDDTESHSEAIVRAVSSAAGRDPVDLPFLYETVDPDALNRVLDGSDADASDSLCVSFQYAGYYVAAEPGRILVQSTSDE